MHTINAGPWYRHPWPWLLMIAPVAAVLGGAATLWLALWSDDGLVAEDYYKQGMAVNRELSRETRAATLGYSAQVNILAQSKRVSVSLANNGSEALPQQVTLRVIHPTRAGADQNIVLTRSASATYYGELQQLPDTRRRLILEDDAQTWRLSGMMSTDRATASVLSAQ